jgi:hypothetical protein
MEASASVKADGSIKSAGDVKTRLCIQRGQELDTRFAFHHTENEVERFLGTMGGTFARYRKVQLALADPEDASKTRTQSIYVNLNSVGHRLHIANVRSLSSEALAHAIEEALREDRLDLLSAQIKTFEDKAGRDPESRQEVDENLKRYGLSRAAYMAAVKDAVERVRADERIGKTTVGIDGMHQGGLLRLDFAQTRDGELVIATKTGRLAESARKKVRRHTDVATLENWAVVKTVDRQGRAQHLVAPAHTKLVDGSDWVGIQRLPSVEDGYSAWMPELQRPNHLMQKGQYTSTYSVNQRMGFVRDTFKGLFRYRDLGMVKLDHKVDNILIDGGEERAEAQLIDFEAERSVEEMFQSTKALGGSHFTPWYTFLDDCLIACDLKDDLDAYRSHLQAMQVFSAALTAYILLTGDLDATQLEAERLEEWDKGERYYWLRNIKGQFVSRELKQLRLDAGDTSCPSDEQVQALQKALDWYPEDRGSLEELAQAFGVTGAEEKQN